MASRYITNFKTNFIMLIIFQMAKLKNINTSISSGWIYQSLSQNPLALSLYPNLQTKHESYRSQFLQALNIISNLRKDNLDIILASQTSMYP